MKIHPRFARLATSLSIAALIGWQIPVRPGVADAYDGKPVVDVNTIGGQIVTATATAVTLSLVGVTLLHTEELPNPYTTSFFLGSNQITITSVDGKLTVTGLPAVVTTENASAVSLLATSTGTARELIDRCPELAKMLESEGPFTMFLPSDKALEAVKLDGEKLEALLKRHIVFGRYSFSDLSNLSDGAKLRTLAETELTVTHDGDKVLVGGATVPNDAHVGSNGVSFTIDGLL